MEDGVKFIFKTLIKVPVIIFVSFLVFNVFAFGLSYFKLLGLSYVALQTAVENNYIPPQEEATLRNYMENTLKTEMLQDVDFTPGTTYTRGQYGESITVGVQARYNFILPLTPKQQMRGEVDGATGTGRFQGWLSEMELDALRDSIDQNKKTNIVIEYNVPGLRYYSDLE